MISEVRRIIVCCNGGAYASTYPLWRVEWQLAAAGYTADSFRGYL